MSETGTTEGPGKTPEPAQDDRAARRAAKQADKAARRAEKAAKKAAREQAKQQDKELRARERARRKLEAIDRREERRKEKAERAEARRQRIRYMWRLRGTPSLGLQIIAISLFMIILIGVWAYVTAGQVNEERIVSPTALPSPWEVVESFPRLWMQRALARNIVASYWRVFQGLGAAILIGVPLGILCGAWPPINAFFSPATLFGRNVPIAALVPLTVLWFGTDELQKVAFIFVATVMFIVFDSARAVANVPDKYVHTAYTLGASRTQVLFKVLVPLAAPSIYGSLRLLFGLAFGYIILAEMINMDKGLGTLIWMSRRRGWMDHVYLILIIMTSLAFLIDRLMLYMSHWLFPFRENK